MPRSRRRLNATRRLARVGLLPSVIIGSTTRRSSFALGRGVWMTSCFNSDTVMLRNIARRGLLGGLSFLSPCRGRIFFSLRFDSGGPGGLQTGRRPVLELHAESQPARGQNFLDLVQRFPAQIGRLEKLGLGALDQVADVVDVFRLKAIRRAYRELEIVHRTQQDRIDLGGLLFLD